MATTTSSDIADKDLPLREDIRLLRDSKEPTEDEVGTEGHREVSWIWQTGDKQQGTIPGIANGTSNLDNL